MGGFVRASSSGASLRGKLRGRATGASCGGATLENHQVQKWPVAHRKLPGAL